MSSKSLSTVRALASLRYFIPLYGPLYTTDTKVCRQIKLDLYLFSPDWRGLSLLFLKKHVSTCTITLMGEIALEFHYPGYTLSMFLNTNGNLLLLLNCLRSRCLGRNPKDGCVFKGDYRASHYSTVGKAIAYRQIRLDVYLFSREWKCFNLLALRNYNTSCLNMPLGYGVHSCGDDKVNEQHADDCCVLDQIVRHDLAIMCTFRDFHKLEIIKINTSRQIKLDLYLFSRDLNGSTSFALFECETDYLTSFEDELTCWDLFSMGDYRFTRNCSQSTPLGIWAGNSYIWHGYKELFITRYIWSCWMSIWILFASWWYLKDLLAMLFPYNQS